MRGETERDERGERDTGRKGGNEKGQDLVQCTQQPTDELKSHQ